MRVGTLEIQIMAGLARISQDMKQAERIVSSSMSQVERSVAGAKRAMQSLGVGVPAALIVDQVRRITDAYTKLDAQLQLSTKSQAQYAQGMADIRRISTVAQTDITATSMLYTRLMNVMDGTGVSQAKLATVTETVSYGLKAYGATAQEAASASLQLSQAMGANRLGGEEFRAVMEAMPNVMKVLATSMGVPLGELRALSIAGKITAAEMVKAFGDPAIAEEFRKLAMNAQTITGAWTVARNELMLLVGEFMKGSGATGGIITAFNALAGVIRITAQYLDQIIAAFTIWAAVSAVNFITAMTHAIVVTRAHAEALLINAAGNKAHAEVVAATSAAETEAIAVATAAKKAQAVMAKQAAAEITLAANAEAAAVTAASAVIKTAAAESALAVKVEKEAIVAASRLATAEAVAASERTSATKLAAAEASVAATQMELAATREMILLAREQELSKLAAANSSVKAAELFVAGARASGAGLHFQTMAERELITAIQARSAAMAELAMLGTQQARVDLAQAAASSRRSALQIEAAWAEAHAMNAAFNTRTAQVAAGESQRTAIMAAAHTERLALAEAAVAREAVLNKARIAQSEQFIAAKWVEAHAVNAAMNKEIAATVAATAAEKARNAATLTGLGKIAGFVKGAAGKAGWIGMALFGAWSVYDFLNGMQQVADGADKLSNQLKEMTLQEAQLARQKELIHQIGLRNSVLSKFNEAEIRASQDRMREYDKQIAKMVELANAKQVVADVPSGFTHDQMVILERYNDLLDQKNKLKLTEGEFEKKVHELYLGSTKAIDKKNKAIDDHIVKLREEADTYGMTAEAIAQYESARLGGNVIQQEQAAAEARHVEELKKIEKYLKEGEELKKRSDDRKRDYEAEDIAKRQKEHQDFWDSIDKTAHDTFVSILDGGKDAATRLRDTFKNIFFDWLYQMTMKKWVVNLSGTVSMGGAGGAMAEGMGGAAMGGSLGVAGSALSVGLSAGTGASASYAGAALSTGSYASAIGFSAAAAVPYLAAALLIAKYGFGMGNSAEKVGAQRLSGSVSSSGVDARLEQDWQKKGGWFTFDKNWKEYTAMSEALRKRIASDAESVRQVFIAYGKAVGDTTVPMKYFNADVNDLANGIGSQLVPALEEFRLEGETLVDTAQRMTAQIEAANAYVKSLEDVAIAQFKSAVDAKNALRATAASIREFAAGLTAATPGSLQAAFLKLSALAAQGDTAAQGKLQGAATNYLAQAKTGAGSALDYARIVGQVQAELNATANALDATATDAELQLTELQVANEYLRAISVGIQSGNIATEVTNAALADGIITYNEANDIDRAIAASVELGTMTAEAGVAINEMMRAAMLDGNATADESRAITDALAQSTIDGSGGNAAVSAIKSLETVMALLTASTQQAANVAALKNMVGADFVQANLTLDNAAGTATYQQDRYTQLVASAGGDLSTVVDTALQKADAAARKQYLDDHPREQYLDMYKDVANDPTYGSRPWDHWRAYGWREGRKWHGKTYDQAPEYPLAAIRMREFAIGTNYIPHDMVAKVHAGEEIKPAPYVDMERAERTESTRSMRSMVAELTGLRSEVAQLRAEAQSERVALVGTSQRTERILDKWDHIGMPEVQTA